MPNFVKIYFIIDSYCCFLCGGVNVCVCVCGGGGIIGGSCYRYHFCHNARFVTTKHTFCHDKSMVAATYCCGGKIFLSQQISVVTKTKICFPKFFVTKMILVATPANDSSIGG